MIIAIAADHAGFALKEKLRGFVAGLGHTVLDLGADSDAPSDYPDHAQHVGNALQEGRAERGILICGSGVGVCIAANKLRGIFAGMCHDTYSAHQGVEHDQMNVLVMGARVIGDELAKDITVAFLKAQFSGEARHRERLRKLALLEKQGA